MTQEIRHVTPLRAANVGALVYGLRTAAIYNVVIGWTGGLQIELSEPRGTPVPGMV